MTGTILAQDAVIGGEMHGHVTPLNAPANAGDRGWSVAVDDEGNAFVAGEAYPTVEQNAMFVAKVDAGGAFAWRTVMGGTHDLTSALAVAVDDAGNVYVAGTTGATDFPYVAPFTIDEGCCGFAARFRAADGAVVWSTPIDGHGFGGTTPYGIAVDDAANIYVCGDTNAPTDLIHAGSGGFQTVMDGPSDLFLVRVQQDIGPLTVLSDTTRWKPQRSTEPMDVVFESPVELASATLEIRNSSGVLIAANYGPLQVVSANPPRVYSVAWTGPWTLPNGAPLLPPDNYSVRVEGIPQGGGSAIQSAPYDKMSLVEVRSIQLEPAEGGSFSPNPNLGGGLRIFAEATEPSDVNPTAEIFDRARVTATIEPALPDVASLTKPLKVYFRTLDVDDPSPIEQEGQTTDNRGIPVEGTLAGLSGPTAGTQVVGSTATTFFKVSMRQGDNYRIAASTHQPWLADLSAVQGVQTGGVQHATEGLVPEGANLTSMLTVWRRLHVELDRMDAPSQNQDSFQMWLTIEDGAVSRDRVP